MVCSKCGKEVFEGVKYCPNCASPILENIYAQQSINYNSNQEVMHTNLNQTNNYPQQTNFNNNVMNNKKNNSWIYILCFVGLMIFICGIIIIFTDKPEVKEEVPTENSSSNTNSNIENDNTVKTLTFKNYTFTIPSTYVTSISNKNQLQVVSEDKNEIYVYDIQTGSYDSLKKNKNRIKEEFEKKDYIVENIIVRSYEGREFIIVEVVKEDIKMLLTYSKLSSTETFMVAVANSSYKIDYSLMNNVASVLKRVTHA